MQMYLALHHKHDVEIAEDEESLLQILDENCADITFLDLNYASDEHNGETGFKLAEQVRQKYPNLRVIGIHDGQNSTLENKALKIGLTDLITRPIKNRELMKAINMDLPEPVSLASKVR
jgi:DNA-binding NtrC family response regulator